MRLGLVLSEASQGLRRNIAMVISVILVTFISLTFVGAAILLQMQIGQMKGYWYDRSQVAVYFCTDSDSGGNCAQADATSDQIAAVKAQLDSATLKPYVKKVSFETHKEAFANFKSQFSDSPLASITTPAMLNQSYRINLVDPNQASIIIDSLKNLPGVQDVEDQRGYLDQIFAVLNAASYTAIGLASLMLVAAVLLIATTIRLSAFSRRREIGIMRLVGASNRFIQTPFILEACSRRSSGRFSPAGRSSLSCSSSCGGTSASRSARRRRWSGRPTRGSSFRFSSCSARCSHPSPRALPSADT